MGPECYCFKPFRALPCTAFDSLTMIRLACTGVTLYVYNLLLRDLSCTAQECFAFRTFDFSLASCLAGGKERYPLQ